jgi:mannose-6-phosphate isomerase-like protein (cupin superfamily)
MKHAQVRFGQGFRVLFGNRRAQMAQMVIAPGSCEGNSGNRHKGADQWLYVVSGIGAATVNGKSIRLRSGTLLLIERNDRHEIRNTSRRPLRTLNCYTPPAYSAAGNELRAGRSR